MGIDDAGRRLLVNRTHEGPGPGLLRVHDRYAPGLHHVAWHADSRGDVDNLHRLLIEIGATVLDPPADCPTYGDGYYAVFFADPDGIKLEFVHLPSSVSYVTSVDDRCQV